jgi:hypothetical protein
MCQLHLLRLLADHDQQDSSEHDACEHQHLLMRQLSIRYESQNIDERPSSTP